MHIFTNDNVEQAFVHQEYAKVSIVQVAEKHYIRLKVWSMLRLEAASLCSLDAGWTITFALTSRFCSPPETTNASPLRWLPH